MTTRTLQKNEWQPYFDSVSKSLLGKGVEIQVLSEDIGAQQEALSWQMLGVTYDPRNNILEVISENLDHMIENPTSIRVEEEGLALKTIEVTQDDGSRQIISILDTVRLPFDKDNRGTTSSR